MHRTADVLWIFAVESLKKKDLFDKNIDAKAVIEPVSNGTMELVVPVARQGGRILRKGHKAESLVLVNHPSEFGLDRFHD